VEHFTTVNHSHGTVTEVTSGHPQFVDGEIKLPYTVYGNVLQYKLPFWDIML
jgi:hypothetical protein